MFSSSVRPTPGFATVTTAPATTPVTFLHDVCLSAVKFRSPRVFLGPDAGIRNKAYIKTLWQANSLSDNDSIDSAERSSESERVEHAKPQSAMNIAAGSRKRRRSKAPSADDTKSAPIKEKEKHTMEKQKQKQKQPAAVSRTFYITSQLGIDTLDKKGKPLVVRATSPLQAARKAAYSMRRRASSLVVENCTTKAKAKATDKSTEKTTEKATQARSTQVQALHTHVQALVKAGKVTQADADAYVQAWTPALETADAVAFRDVCVREVSLTAKSGGAGGDSACGDTHGGAVRRYTTGMTMLHKPSPSNVRRRIVRETVSKYVPRTALKE